MRNGRYFAFLLAAVLVVAAACTNSSEESTVTPVPPTRSSPTQPPANPFDLVATVFPSTPTPRSPVPTPPPVPTSTPLSPSAQDFRATPTPIAVGPDQLLFNTNIGFGGSLPVFDGESFWFTDEPFAVRTSLTGEITGRFQVARSDPPQLVFAGDHIWALDVAEGELRKVTLGGETAMRTRVQLASGMDVAADSIFVYARTSERMTRFNLDGERVDEFEIAIGSGIFNVTEDRIWVKTSVLSSYSHSGELLTRWELPGGDSVADLQVSDDYVWLFGSPVEFLRVDVETGEVERFGLAMEQGEFVSGAASVTGGLVLDNSVWVVYTRSMVPFGEPGSLATTFRRLEVFDFDGNMLRTREFDEDSFALTLGQVSVLGEVWMVLAGSPGRTLFQRLPIDDFVLPENRFSAERLAVPEFPDWLDPELAVERPEDAAIFGGWEEFLAGNALVVDDLFAYHFCEDGPMVIPGGGPLGLFGSPFVAPEWSVGEYTPGSADDWGSVFVNGDPLSLHFERRDGGFLFSSQGEAVLSRSTICLGLE